MRTVILVPRREGVPERDAIWAWCRRWWEANFPDLPLYEGHHDDGPFNRAAAVNLASRLADADGRWDQAIILDADIYLDPERVRDAIAAAARTGKVTWAFQWWAGTTRATAERILDGRDDPAALVTALNVLHAAGEANSMGVTPVPPAVPAGVEKVNPISWSCCFVVPRPVFHDLGGFDERFRGWGWEDMAWQSAVCGLHGHERIPGALVHLWHPRSPGLGDDGIFKRKNRQLGRRYMHALRVKGFHDRAEPSDEEEMERDRRNIRRLALRIEEVDRHGQPARDLPDWRDWWPSLEELRDSWKAGKSAGPAPRVSLIVRSGGPASTWEVRSGYLRQALASLEANLAYGSIVRRVIYSDWPASVRPELDAIAGAHGFYVVGEGNLGYTASTQRLWRYLASRRDAFEFVFLAEDDFVYERPVDLEAMIEVLASRPHLTQMALLRDAFYQAERDKGGILGWPQSSFECHEAGDARWLEHRNFWTANPSVFRRSLVHQPWPTGRSSERLFADRLFLNPAAAAGFWGSGEPWIRHVGEVRAGSGY